MNNLIKKSVKWNPFSWKMKKRDQKINYDDIDHLNKTIEKV